MCLFSGAKILTIISKQTSHFANVNKRGFVVLRLALLLMITATAAPAQGILDWLFSSGKPITAEITLDNRCKVKSDYFVVRDLDTGEYAKFFRDKATLETKSGSPIQLQLSPSVKGVFYEGVAVSARKKMKIKADCTTRSLGGVDTSSTNPFLKSD